MNSNFLRQIEQENQILEQELEQLLKKQDHLRFSFSQKPEEELDQNFKSTTVENTNLSQIDEEIEEEQPQQPIQQYDDTMLDNLMDSINNYMVKRSDSSEPKSHRQSETKRNESSQKQIKSLEMRLSGTREAMKQMEKELKEKNTLIQSLQIELSKKQKIIDGFKPQQIVVPALQTESFQELKKNLQQAEKKVQEGENQLKENKKYMQRLQELNQSLLFKLKELEVQKSAIDTQDADRYNSVLIRYEQTIISMQKELMHERDKNKNLNEKYAELKKNSDSFLLSSKDLKSQYEHMLNTLQQIANQ